jgi:hypothetical protein
MNPIAAARPAVAEAEHAGPPSHHDPNLGPNERSWLAREAARNATIPPPTQQPERERTVRGITDRDVHLMAGGDPAQTPPEELARLQALNFQNEQWRRLWTDALGSLPRPPRPEALDAAGRAAEARVIEVMEPIVAKWRESPQYAEVARLRTLRAEAAQAADRAADAARAARREYEDAARGDGGPLYTRFSAMDQAERHARDTRAWADSLVADELRQAEEAARSLLESSLLSAAALEQDAADKRVAGLRRDVATQVAQAIPAVTQGTQLRVALAPDALRRKFADQLRELT